MDMVKIRVWQDASSLRWHWLVEWHWNEDLGQRKGDCEKLVEAYVEAVNTANAICFPPVEA